MTDEVPTETNEPATITRSAIDADKGPWPTEPYLKPSSPPTLEERIRRIEIGLWIGGEAPPWVIDAERAERPEPEQQVTEGETA